MDKFDIVIPKGIRYISQFQDFNLNNFPFPFILDKVLTGCGFTEKILTDDSDSILISPRKMLLENKESQHQGEIFYARNEYDNSCLDFDREIGKYGIEVKRLERLEEFKRKQQSDLSYLNNKSTRIIELKQKIKEYFFDCRRNQKPCKILVTYDSFRHVKEALIEIMGFTDFLNKFQIVVDEFQSIFIDAKFKSDTEMELMNFLRDLQKVCFVSATPMMDKYLEELDEFKDLPYYRFDWETEDQGRIIRPNLKVHKTRSILSDLSAIIKKYKNNDFEKDSRIDSFGFIKETYSKEAVFYVNSVKTICSIIKKEKLDIKDCNVLCARTDENEKRIRESFNEVLQDKGFPKILSTEKVIGNIPRRGEPHKMFTFCTRTVYLGADFYSTNARTFIFSDSNIDCLSVDISLDLPQILGRQRLDENPWKNCAELYVKSTIDNFTREDFDREIVNKIEKTNSLLLSYESSPTLKSKHDLAEAYRDRAFGLKYQKDYVAVNSHGGKDLFPIFNKLMLIAEKRTFDIQQIDYKDRISVINTLKSAGYNNLISIESDLKNFDSLPNFQTKLKYLCETNFEETKLSLFLESIPKIFKNYYLVLGPERCKAFGYSNYYLKKEYDKLLNNQSINTNEVDEIIYQSFEIGKRYFKSDIKEILKNIYLSKNYQKTPKASDLQEYFEVKIYQATNPKSGKKENGFEILNKKRVD